MATLLGTMQTNPQCARFRLPNGVRTGKGSMCNLFLLTESTFSGGSSLESRLSTVLARHISYLNLFKAEKSDGYENTCLDCTSIFLEQKVIKS